MRLGSKRVSHVWSISSLLEAGSSSAAEERVQVCCVLTRSLYVFLTTEIMLVWCRAYDCRSVSVGLIFPLFRSAGALVPLYLVSMDPSKDWLAAPFSDFDSVGDR